MKTPVYCSSGRATMILSSISLNYCMTTDTAHEWCIVDWMKHDGVNIPGVR